MSSGEISEENIVQCVKCALHNLLNSTQKREVLSDINKNENSNSNNFKEQQFIQENDINYIYNICKRYSLNYVFQSEYRKLQIINENTYIDNYLSFFELELISQKYDYRRNYLFDSLSHLNQIVSDFQNKLIERQQIYCILNEKPSVYILSSIVNETLLTEYFDILVHTPVEKIIYNMEENNYKDLILYDKGSYTNICNYNTYDCEGFLRKDKLVYKNGTLCGFYTSMFVDSTNEKYCYGNNVKENIYTLPRIGAHYIVEPNGDVSNKEIHDRYIGQVVLVDIYENTLYVDKITGDIVFECYCQLNDDTENYFNMQFTGNLNYIYSHILEVGQYDVERKFDFHYMKAPAIVIDSNSLSYD